jgi:hypothetical protein
MCRSLFQWQKRKSGMSKMQGRADEGWQGWPASRTFKIWTKTFQTCRNSMGSSVFDACLRSFWRFVPLQISPSSALGLRPRFQWQSIIPCHTLSFIINGRHTASDPSRQLYKIFRYWQWRSELSGFFFLSELVSGNEIVIRQLSSLCSVGCSLIPHLNSSILISDCPILHRPMRFVWLLRPCLYGPRLLSLLHNSICARLANQVFTIRVPQILWEVSYVVPSDSPILRLELYVIFSVSDKICICRNGSFLEVWNVTVLLPWHVEEFQDMCSRRGVHRTVRCNRIHWLFALSRGQKWIEFFALLEIESCNEVMLFRGHYRKESDGFSGTHSKESDNATFSASWAASCPDASLCRSTHSPLSVPFRAWCLIILSDKSFAIYSFIWIDALPVAIWRKRKQMWVSLKYRWTGGVNRAIKRIIK